VRPWRSGSERRYLHSGPVGTLDAHGAIDAESSAGLPGEHVCGAVLLQESASAERTEDAALDGPLHFAPVLGRQ